MKLEIDKELKTKMEQEIGPGLQEELRKFKTNSRKFTIKAAIIMTAIILAVVAFIFLVHLLRSQPFTDAYLKKHLIRFLIAEFVFVGIPVLSDIALNKQSKNDLLESLGALPNDNITYDVTEQALVRLEDDKEESRYMFEDISDIRSEENHVLFHFNEKEVSIPDYFTPSLYEVLKEAKDNYISVPKTNTTRKVMPKKLSRSAAKESEE